MISKVYNDILKAILSSGEDKFDYGRNVMTKSIFGYQIKVPLNPFPAITNKKLFYNSVVDELLWFLQGDAYASNLNSSIWDKDAFNFMKKLDPLLTKEEFDDSEKYVGRTYGVQWRDWNKEVDQIERLLEALKENPNSRRHLVTAWNPSDFNNTALPPCHVMFQVNISNGYLDLMWTQRSCDVGLGLPFNIASYATLAYILAKYSNTVPRNLIGNIGDMHLYSNQLKHAKTMIDRGYNEDTTKLHINKSIQSLDDVLSLQLDDFELFNYNPKSAIKIEMLSETK